ncbi:uncharacterized protein LOC125521241 isoform X1 [Triticum urartu]|uniref:uncharacterized protein LOC125521241 isoform X1 n=1 Tax=Triticum urartu TaxID=4572 RepID=UPI0020434053|nr:uncharacterized protein LOC125521241 isoform X1 [Triticum urartu]
MPAGSRRRAAMAASSPPWAARPFDDSLPRPRPGPLNPNLTNGSGSCNVKIRKQDMNHLAMNFLVTLGFIDATNSYYHWKCQTDLAVKSSAAGSFTWLASYVTGVVVSMWKESPLLRDAGADMLTVGDVMAVLDFREEVGNHHFLDQRKNVINTVTNPSDLCYGCRGDCWNGGFLG